VISTIVIDASCVAVAGVVDASPCVSAPLQSTASEQDLKGITASTIDSTLELQHVSVEWCYCVAPPPNTPRVTPLLVRSGLGTQTRIQRLGDTLRAARVLLSDPELAEPAVLSQLVAVAGDSGGVWACVLHELMNSFDGELCCFCLADALLQDIVSRVEGIVENEDFGKVCVSV
jgi:hypothetical protein